jgi:hypothetical protein
MRAAHPAAAATSAATSTLLTMRAIGPSAAGLKSALALHMLHFYAFCKLDAGSGTQPRELRRPSISP